jgi:hypothetical protein
MPSRARLRLLADYFAATRNEIAVDEMFLALSKLQAAHVGHLPRVPHWMGLAQRRPALTRSAWRLARGAWLAGGAALFFALEYVKFSRQRRKAAAAPASLPEDGAILGLSTRVCDIVQPGQFPAFPRTWLTLPWVPQHCLPEGARELPMLSLLNGQDLRRSLADALTSTCRMRRDSGLSAWVLQSYTAFRWFLARRATDRLSGTLVTTEHFDRWAVLADRSVRESRRGARARRRLVVVQHGALGALDKNASEASSSLKPSTRLREVDELHVYNAAEEAAFRSGVIVGGAASRPVEVRFFMPDIELTGSEVSSRLRILFVGHPLCEPFQAAVFHALREKHEFDAFYKPHPKAPMSGAMATIGWTIIDDPQVFPRVDLLVSYPSTLVIEYEGKGVPASVHPLGISREELPGFVAQTQALIEAEQSESN